jgi:P27 family predicted phage terminase small subunit
VKTNTAKTEKVKKPKPPVHLSAAAKAVWRSVAEDYDLASEPHALLVLSAGLEAHDRKEQARKELARDGLSVATESGSLKSHPAIAVERDSRLAMVRCFRELSLDAGEVFGGGGYEQSRPPRVGGGHS